MSARDAWVESVIVEDYRRAYELSVVDDDIVLSSGRPLELRAARAAWLICVRSWNQRQRDGFGRGELSL